MPLNKKYWPAAVAVCLARVDFVCMRFKFAFGRTTDGFVVPAFCVWALDCVRLLPFLVPLFSDHRHRWVDVSSKISVVSAARWQEDRCEFRRPK